MGKKGERRIERLQRQRFQGGPQRQESVTGAIVNGKRLMKKGKKFYGKKRYRTVHITQGDLPTLLFGCPRCAQNILIDWDMEEVTCPGCWMHIQGSGMAEQLWEAKQRGVSISVSVGGYGAQVSGRLQSVQVSGQLAYVRSFPVFGVK